MARAISLPARLSMALAVLAAAGSLLGAQPPGQRPLRPLPEALAAASPELVARLRADPFAYFRFINRAWTARVCEALADVPNPTVVRLHGDAHVEQFAVTQDAWGLSDFDDSARGPIFVDIVRFLGSLDLAARQHGWTRERDAIWDRFFAGYRRGLFEPEARAPVPDIVRHLRRQAHTTRAAHLAWGERQMLPMADAQLQAVAEGMAALDRLVRRRRPNLALGYFTVVRAGWLRIGVGSAGVRKVLIRVQGPTISPSDDRLIEGKEVVNLDGVACLEKSKTAPAIRVIGGSRQIGRLKPEILAVGPTLLVPAIAERADLRTDWWLASWEPSYRELHISDLRSVADLSDIAFDVGLQLGVGRLAAARQASLTSLTTLEARLRKETSVIVEELLAGWNELQAR